MQVKSSQYNSDKHVFTKCLTVKQPYAYLIGLGDKTLEIRSKPTKYRGELMISSSAKPICKDSISGALICSVILMDCVPVKNLTDNQWDKSYIQEPKENYINHYAWVFASPKRTVEIPIKGSLGIWSLCIGKEDIYYYPEEVSGIEKHIDYEKPTISRKLTRTVIILLIMALGVIIMEAWLSV